MRVELSRTQTIAWEHLEDDQPKTVFFGGSAGGGKSMLGCIWHIYRRIKHPGSRGFLARRELKDLRLTTLVTFFEVANKMGYEPIRDYTYNQQDNVIKWRNGSVTVLQELSYKPTDPDYQRLGSSEYTDGFVDEAPECKQKAVEIMQSRIRYRLSDYGIARKLLITGNPGPHWVKKSYVMYDDDNPIELPPERTFIRSTLADNPDRGFAEMYKQNLLSLTDDYDIKRLLYGDWSAQPNINNPFVPQFNEKRHVKECTYDPQLPTYISIDFNVDPFCAIVFQFSPNFFYIVDEIEVWGGTIDEMAMAITHYPLHMMEITGDRTGANRRIGQADNLSMFDTLARTLRLRSRQLVLPPNPTHKISRDQCNLTLSSYPDFRIHPKCKGLIRDLKNVEVDQFGSIKKANRSQVDQRADHIDCFRYAVNTYLYKWFKNQHR